MSNIIRLKKLVPGDHPLAVRHPDVVHLDAHASAVLAMLRRGASVRRIALAVGVSEMLVKAWLMVHSPRYWPAQRHVDRIIDLAVKGVPPPRIAAQIPGRSVGSKLVVSILYVAGWTPYVDASRIAPEDWHISEMAMAQKYRLPKSSLRTIRYTLGHYLRRFDIEQYALEQRARRSKVRRVAREVVGCDLSWLCVRVLLVLAERGPSTVPEICAALGRRSPIDGELQTTFAKHLVAHGLIAREPRSLARVHYRYWLTPRGLDALSRIITALGGQTDGGEATKDQQRADTDPIPAGSPPRRRRNGMARP